MSNDEADKTVMRGAPAGRAPSASHDADSTKVRTQVGAARDDGRGRASGYGANPAASSRASMASSDYSPPTVESIEPLRSSSGNPLVAAATPLLLLAASVGEAGLPQAPQNLKNEVIRAVRKFESDARESGVNNESLVTGRYLLCAFIDEAILATPWGEEAGWDQQTALMLFHKESWGGKKFFQILDRAKQDPRKHFQLLELIYLCLALGFYGQYRLETRGEAMLGEIRLDLYRRLKEVRGTVESSLAMNWKPAGVGRVALSRRIPLWVGAVASFGVLLLLYIVLFVQLSGLGTPIRGQLAKIGFDLPPPAEARAPAVRKISLKQLLQADESKGLLTVDELNDRSIVSLGGDGFASGSADLRPAWSEALTHVRDALRQLDGRVYVVGHTDDVPLRSVRFRDNYELSVARARACLQVLAPEPSEQARFEVTGVGSDQPRYQPVNQPENRTRNRRVEIIYLEGGSS